MKKNYYIDPTILGLLLQIEDESEKVKAYSIYMQRLENVLIKGMEKFVDEGGYSEEEKQALKQNILSIKNAELDESSDGGLDILIAKFKNPQLQEKLNLLIQELNKLIYDTYIDDLSAERRTELDDYINTFEETLKTGANYIKNIIEMVKEDEEALTMPSPQGQPAVNLTQPH